MIDFDFVTSHIKKFGHDIDEGTLQAHVSHPDGEGGGRERVIARRFD